MKVIYKYSFGHDTLGEVRENKDGEFQCFETPLYGGEFQEVGKLFIKSKDAIEYLKSLT